MLNRSKQYYQPFPRRTPSPQEAREFDSYLQSSQRNLIAAMNNPAIFHDLFEMLMDLKTERVLDIGCGIGQMLYPFVALKKAFGVGLDPSAQACQMGREFYAAHVPGARIRFVYGRAETLPFASSSFDVVNCSLALPYMNNPRALDEIVRVLRPGGILLLKIHHFRYYLHDLWRGLISSRAVQMVHAGRVLSVGAIYHLTGHQPETRLLGDETFQTRWLLGRELSRRGLVLERERYDTSPQTPAFVISRMSSDDSIETV